ncbi:hypothetical protein N665_0084s0038 [Sinapis alba]|nr:hypothetical protein N665_0084s0038 [Sinapis alba]
MLQSQLVTSSRDMKNGEGVQKWLKISVPHFDNSDLIKGYSKTHIGRCMNPEEQDIKASVVILLRIWKLENRVIGADLGLGKFKVDFENEEDIEAVMKMHPVLGFPLEFWAVPTFESVGDALGRTVEVDLDFRRVNVIVDGFKELCFKITVVFSGGEFHEGEEAQISLRSYKGVVIKGNTGQQDMERGKRDNHGKGKGKMFDDQKIKNDYIIPEVSIERRRVLVIETTEGSLREKILKITVQETLMIRREEEISAVEIVRQQTWRPERRGRFRLQVLEEQHVSLLENVLEMEEISDCLIEDKDLENEEKEFQGLTDEETGEDGTWENGIGEIEASQDGNGDEFSSDTAVTKQDELFKPLITGAGSNKLRLVHALASPRKRSFAKSSTRQGDSLKQMENRGASNPPPGLPRP